MLDREREIYREQARATGKPDPVIEKIVNGKMEKFYEENCLYEQHFIKDESLTVQELIHQAVAKLGENISVRRFFRLKVGEDKGAPAAGAAEGSQKRKPFVPRASQPLDALFFLPQRRPGGRRVGVFCDKARGSPNPNALFGGARSETYPQPRHHGTHQ